MATSKKIHQFTYITKRYSKTYLGIAISVVLFVLFFQPFAIKKFDFEDRWLFISGLGLIIFICLLLSQIIFQRHLIKHENISQATPVYLPLFYFTQVATATLSFVFYIRYVGQIPITFNTVVRIVIICLALPVTIHLRNIITSYRARIKKLIYESRSIQDKLNKFSENPVHQYIEILSENDSDNFRVQVSEIVYLKSADNYVEAGYFDEGVVKKKMVRNTLRNIEQQLAVFSNFVRTHRTSLVNIQHIDKLNKNFSTYWLSLYSTTETVPVSRQYLMAIKDLL